MRISYRLRRRGIRRRLGGLLGHESVAVHSEHDRLSDKYDVGYSPVLDKVRILVCWRQDLTQS